MRGTHERAQADDAVAGLIPARAGNTGTEDLGSLSAYGKFIREVSRSGRVGGTEEPPMNFHSWVALQSLASPVSLPELFLSVPGARYLLQSMRAAIGASFRRTSRPPKPRTVCLENLRNLCILSRLLRVVLALVLRLWWYAHSATRLLGPLTWSTSVARDVQRYSVTALVALHWKPAALSTSSRICRH